MINHNDINSIINRIASGEYTSADITVLHEVLSLGDRAVTPEKYRQAATQLGKYNINIGQGQSIQIGDHTYVEFNNEATQALIQAIRTYQHDRTYAYLDSTETCNNRQSLDKYFEVVLERLRQQGSLDIRRNVVHRGKKFNYVAKIEDFELPIGLLNMRGEAFFMFSEFVAIQAKTLQQFSGLCIQWAKEQVNPSAVGQAIFNFRFPTHICFAIAIVDEIDEKTRVEVQTTNPFSYKVDLLWYEVPLIYEFSKQKLYFYEKPSNFFENFKGEVVWRKLRTVIQQILVPLPDLDSCGESQP
ncbi:MAG: hypothetical protein SAK29_38375 [Scytonema sp. PMC 1069.18]|nr:hypothetical protein [Scytonema sp. PMC 1069.18]MEC4888203.1 hypothetical protein [Scytonema sp. PMC 1070.18]